MCFCDTSTLLVVQGTPLSKADSNIDSDSASLVPVDLAVPSDIVILGHPITQFDTVMQYNRACGVLR